MTRKIRVPVNGGYIVAERNPDRNYDGVSIYFESDDGCVLDIVVVESPLSKAYLDINVYNYADVYQEDFTSKHTLSISEIKKALEE